MKQRRGWGLGLLFGLAAQGFGWHATGHMVVAEIALRRLDDPVRRSAIGLLEAAGLDARTSDFRTASVWADDHKTQADANWHFINYYFRTDGKKVVGKPLPENVVTAIRRFAKVLGDKSRSRQERGKALVWLLHFVGDIHQPMHAVAFESDALPNGDRGGNDTRILPPPGLRPEPRNLHFLWDMGAGVFPEIVRPLNDEGQRILARLADQAEAAVDRRGAGGAVGRLDPEVWAKESFELAKSHAYDVTPGTEPDSLYLQKVRELSLWRVGLAGRRLAALINHALRAKA